MVVCTGITLKPTERFPNQEIFIFDVHVTLHHDKFLIINQPDAPISQIYSWNETLHVSDSSYDDHQEFFTVHAAMVYVIQVLLTACEQEHLLLLASCQQNLCGRAARLLRSWVRIPPGAWIFVCCECRVLSGRGLCDELITRPEEPYRLCRVVVCDLETSRMGAPYIYDISRLRVNDLTFILLTWRKW